MGYKSIEPAEADLSLNIFAICQISAEKRTGAPHSLVQLTHYKNGFIDCELCGHMISIIHYRDALTISQTNLHFSESAVKVFWKHCGKRRYCLTLYQMTKCKDLSTGLS